MKVDRRKFLKSLPLLFAAFLAKPGIFLDRLLGSAQERWLHIVVTSDGADRRLWIDGAEVQCSGTGGNFAAAPIALETGDLTGSWDIVYMLPADVKHLGPEISWARLVDDSPFEPPPRTDPPVIMDLEAGDGLLDSW